MSSLAALPPQLILGINMRVVFLPAFMDPEPLFRVFTNHAFHRIGYQLSIGLDIGAQIAGPFDVKGMIDMHR